jgi:hypothetical protein
MANPRNEKILDGASGNQTSANTRANGHYVVTLFAWLSSLDTNSGDTLTLQLEGSADGTHWDTIKDEGGNDVSLDQSDFSDDPDSGNDVASITVESVYYDLYRVRIKNFNDASGSDLEATVHLMAAGNGAGSGASGNPYKP